MGKQVQTEVTTGNPKQPSFFSNFLKWFAIFYIIMFGVQYFFGSPKEDALPVTQEQGVVITPQKDSYVMGNLVTFTLENKSTENYRFVSPCGADNTNLGFFYVTGHAEASQDINVFEKIQAECAISEIGNAVLPAGASETFRMQEYNETLFSKEGNYKMVMNWEGESGEIITAEALVEIEKPGIFRSLFRAIVSRPLFNILVFLTEVLPGNFYGVSIIILTLLVRLLLFIPNQKAMKSQRELQKLQPKLLEIKEKLKGNQQAIAMKTMELYKTHQINPLGGLLPILLQMPFLLGIFYLLQDGISPHLRHLLYSFYANADFAIGNVSFLGLNLGESYAQNGMGQIVLAVIVAGAQFFAVRLSMARSKNQDIKPKKADDPMAAMQNAGKVMMWVMPGLVAVFSISLPAGIGIYWCVSTIFGIGQQSFVNKKLDEPQVRKKVK